MPPWNWTEPAISDINGDGKLKFAGGSDGGLLILNDDGSIYWIRYSSGNLFNTPAVADLDNNGKMEIAAISVPYTTGSTSIAYLWEIPNSGVAAKYDWPTFAHDPARTGELVVNPSKDTIPPSTSITSPLSGATVSGTINVSVSAFDNVGVTSVELYRNGALVGSTTASPYNFAWNTTTVPDGSYTLQSKSYDAANNTGASPFVTVTTSNFVDTTPPKVIITKPLNGAKVAKKMTVTISANASDNVGVTKVELYVNNQLQCADFVAPYSCNWNVPGGKPGVTYSLLAKAYDSKGNVGSSATVKVTSK